MERQRPDRNSAEGLKILGFSVGAAILYGILHDFVTIHVCPEYFTKFHPKVFPTENLWLLALGWGTIATWWMGLFFGALLTAAARTGDLPRMSWKDVAKPVCVMLAVCYVLAALFGLRAYAAPGTVVNPLVDLVMPVSDLPAEFRGSRNFMADYVAHNVSYSASAVGSLVVCGLLIVRRLKLRSWSM